MQFIVLDLEWNQPMTFQGGGYRAAHGKLLFEMLQIGAVKLDSQLQICDTFNQLIQPSCYFRIHPHIRKITQITEDDVADAPLFTEAYNSFNNWCGEDSVLLTWGCDDISVFDQNIHYFGCQQPLLPVYDMQQYFSQLIGSPKERKSLKSAMEYYQIDPNEDKSFHNAANDAYYTALVFAHMEDPEKVLSFPLKARTLVHQDRRKRTTLSVHRASRGPAAVIKTQFAQKTPCPVCGRLNPLSVGYVKQGSDKYTALAKCESHGLYYARLHFYTDEQKVRQAERATALIEEQNKAYVSTKILQWENKLSVQTQEKERKKQVREQKKRDNSSGETT